MKRTLLAATRALCLALVWSLAGPAQRAHAAELRIDWTAPPECVSARDLRARIFQLVGSVPHSSLLATVEVTQPAQNYSAHVVLRGASGFGERVLEDASCDVLAENVAMVIALSVPGPANQAGRGLSLALWPEAQLLLGTLPLTAAGAGAAVAIEGLGSFRFELHGAYYVPQSSTFEQTAFGGEFQLYTIGACVCRLWSFGKLHLGPCLGAEVQHVSASGFGGATQQPGSTSWWGPSFRWFARAQLWPVFGINIAVEGVVPMVRPQFTYSDFQVLHRVGPVALQVSLGPEVRF